MNWDDIKDNPLFKLSVILLIPIATIALILYIAGSIFLQFAGGLSDQKAGITTIIQYWYYYGSDPKVKEYLIWSLVAAVFILFLPIIFIILNPKKDALYGSARWARESEIRKAGLYSDTGIVIGIRKLFFGLVLKYLIWDGLQHVMLTAPTRSGKGVAIVVPNLLVWKDSVIVLDVKQENWDITAGYRAFHGQKCYLLNFIARDYKSHGWNPLSYISEDPYFRINDIQKIGNMLFPTNANEAPIWQASSRSLWLGVVLYLLESKDLPVTLGEVLRQVTMGDEHLKTQVDKRMQSDNKLSDECYLALKEYLDTPEKTRGSIKKGFTSALELFYNPIIDAVTSTNSFDLRRLRKEKMSIYIGVAPGDLEMIQPILNLFYQQALDLNTETLPEKDPEIVNKCLFIMDEVAAIGKLPIMSKGISYFAGYWLRFLPIAQAPSQYRSIYGNDEADTFSDNHALKIIYAPSNFKIAKEISEELGTTTVKSSSLSKSLGFGKGNKSESVSDHSRPLLLPHEVKNLGKKREIIISDDCPPFKCHKIVWYKDKVFKKRGNDTHANIIRFPSPKVPLIDPSKLKRGKLNIVTSSEEQKAQETIKRPVTVKDLENIDNLELSDFSLDFSNIEVPERSMSSAEIEEIAAKFFNVVVNS